MGESLLSSVLRECGERGSKQVVKPARIKALIIAIKQKVKKTAKSIAETAFEAATSSYESQEADAADWIKMVIKGFGLNTTSIRKLESYCGATGLKEIMESDYCKEPTKAAERFIEKPSDLIANATAASSFLRNPMYILKGTTSWISANALCIGANATAALKTTWYMEKKIEKAIEEIADDTEIVYCAAMSSLHSKILRELDVTPNGTLFERINSHWVGNDKEPVPADIINQRLNEITTEIKKQDFAATLDSAEDYNKLDETKSELFSKITIGLGLDEQELKRLEPMCQDLPEKPMSQSRLFNRFISKPAPDMVDLIADEAKRVYCQTSRGSTKKKPKKKKKAKHCTVS